MITRRHDIFITVFCDIVTTGITLLSCYCDFIVRILWQNIWDTEPCATWIASWSRLRVHPEKSETLTADRFLHTDGVKSVNFRCAWTLLIKDDSTYVCLKKTYPFKSMFQTIAKFCSCSQTEFFARTGRFYKGQSSRDLFKNSEIALK